MVKKLMNNLQEVFSELGVVGILSVLIITGVCILIGVALYKEASFGERYGKIVNKEYHPSYYSHVKGGHIYHSERYQFEIEKDGKRLWIIVSEGEYNNMKIGDCYNKC